LNLLSIAFFGTSVGPGEILLVLIVALLLFGAKRLPAIARSLGQAVSEFKRAARNLSNDLLQESPSESEQPEAASEDTAKKNEPDPLDPDNPDSPYHFPENKDLRG
jgi:sec-independent protein translocase protein TatA